MLHDFDVVCDQPDASALADDDGLSFARERDLTMAYMEDAEILDMLLSWEQQIFEDERYEFAVWRHSLEEALTHWVGQPHTDENIARIGSMVDWYFSNVMFQHSDHEVVIERNGPEGLLISVKMRYDDPDDFYEDFEITGDEEMVIDIAELGQLDGLIMVGDNDLIDDAYWAIAEQVAVEMSPDVRQAILEAKAAVTRSVQTAAMSDTESDQVKIEPQINPQSPDDILFEPFEVTKKPEPAKEDCIYDPGDFC